MAYLAGVKAELREQFDEMFKATWEVVERNLKQSYINGIKAAGRMEQNAVGGGADQPVKVEAGSHRTNPKRAS